MPIRIELQKELDRLHQDLVKMGTIIEKSIDDTIEALKTHDVKLAQEIIDRDDEVDALEEKIEEECIQLIARQQPIARDLREITSVLKIITDLERIADHCSDISEYTLKLASEAYIKPLIHIPQMAEEAKKMVRSTIDCYIHRDVETARQVCKQDDVVDEFFYMIVEELRDIMKADPESIRQCTNLIFIVKYLERMADHATNICDWIIYNVTGSHSEFN